MDDLSMYVCLLALFRFIWLLDVCQSLHVQRNGVDKGCCHTCSRLQTLLVLPKRMEVMSKRGVKTCCVGKSRTVKEFQNLYLFRLVSIVAQRILFRTQYKTGRAFPHPVNGKYRSPMSNSSYASLWLMPRMTVRDRIRIACECSRQPLTTSREWLERVA